MDYKIRIARYLYNFSLTGLLILYLFPGSLIGYFLYGDLGKQPDMIPNPIGTSINHALAFFTFPFQVKTESTLLIIFAQATNSFFTRNEAILCASFFLGQVM